MIQVSRNEDLTRSACPVLDNQQAQQFVAAHALPPACSYHEVPPGVIIRGGGFWLRPSVRNHPDATLFLISPDHPFATDEGVGVRRDPVLCFYSDLAQTFYIGRIDGDGLESLLANLYPKIPLASLTFVGRVVATC